MSRKVTFIESATEMGGVEFSTVYLASHLDRSRWNVTVVCPGEGKLASACRNTGVLVKTVVMPGLLSTSLRVGKTDTRFPNPLAWIWNGFAILAAANSLQRFLKQEKSDIIISKGIYAHLCGGLAARWVPSIASSPSPSC